MDSGAVIDLHSTSIRLHITVTSRAIILLQEGSQGCDDITTQKDKQAHMLVTQHTCTAFNKTCQDDHQSRDCRAAETVAESHVGGSSPC